MITDDIDNDDALDTKPSKPAKKSKPAGKEAKAAAKKPSKPVVTKPAAKAAAKPAAKANGKAPPAKAAAKPAKKAKKEDRDTGENRAAILAASVKIKKAKPLMISELAEQLGLPHRTVRTHLRKISADKSTGVTMKKDGAVFVVHGKV